VHSDRNIAEFLEDHAVRRARHAALIEGDRVLTYAELNPLVQRTSGHLANLGIEPDDIVGVALKDSADHLITMFALARLGAVILPLDWRWTVGEKTRLTEFFGVSHSIIEPGDDLADDPAGVICMPIDETWHSAVAAEAADFPCASGGDRPIVLSLSSGTTGRPKGPMMSHAQFIARLMIQWVSLGFSQHDRYLSATPLYFGGGRGFTMGCLFSGSTVIMFPPPYSAQELVDAVTECKPTTLLVVPTILRQLLELPDPGKPLMGGLKRLLSTGAILHPDERDAAMARLNPEFINYYGSTEGGGISVLLPEHQGEAALSVGEPVFSTKVQVVDDNGQSLTPGEAGMIRYSGPSVAKSFHNDPEASAEAFRDGWFYPGDIGKIDEDGRIYLVGRSKDVIIRAGVNIYPAEIEQVLLTHPTVRDAAVVAWPSKMRGEDIAAFVVTNDSIVEEDLINHCRLTLAPYKAPKRIFVIDELPKSPLGKVMKADLVSLLPDQDG
jgi:acyl-CoA synthetase (AMP-forming)/AMP-acid ligase II